MASSKTEIANLALTLLGAEKIPDYSDTSVLNANYVRQFYDQCLEEALRSAPWNFATKRADIPQDTTAPEFGWDYRYPLPSDSVQILEANDIDPLLYEPERFVIEDGYILSDSDTMKVRYIYLNESVGDYPSDFVNALAYLLASKLAVPITGNSQMAGALKSEYDSIERPRAHRQNSNENVGKRRNWILESDLVRKRYQTQ